MKKQKAVTINGIKLDVLVVKTPEGPPSPASPKNWTAFCLTPLPVLKKHVLGWTRGRENAVYSVGLEPLAPVAGSSEEGVLSTLRLCAADRLTPFLSSRSVQIEINSDDLARAEEERQRFVKLTSNT